MSQTSLRTRLPVADLCTLFAECLLVGVIITAALPGVVTILPAWAAGCAHIRAHLDGESTSMRAVAANFAAAWRHSLPISVLLLAGFGLLAVDLVIVRLGLPGGSVISAFCVLVAIGLAAVVMRAGAMWVAGAHWPELVRLAARRATTDLRGSLLLALTLGVLFVVTWQLLPLMIPMLGCAAMAAVAIVR